MLACKGYSPPPTPGSKYWAWFGVPPTGCRRNPSFGPLVNISFTGSRFSKSNYFEKFRKRDHWTEMEGGGGTCRPQSYVFFHNSPLFELEGFICLFLSLFLFKPGTSTITILKWGVAWKTKAWQHRQLWPIWLDNSEHNRPTVRFGIRRRLACWWNSPQIRLSPSC